jgi:DNA-binding PadR family transcriptional regulator
MSSQPKLGAFSYAILGLVGRNGASPHDIVRMMREGAVFWTTSESHFYAEPKRLAKLGYLRAEKRPGRTRERTHYELTDAGRDALRAWLAEPAAMPRIQNEAAIKLLAADFADDATVLGSLAGLREGLADGYRELEAMEARVEDLPHRARYLRLLNELARRTFDAQREWLDHVERELGGGDGR